MQNIEPYFGWRHLYSTEEDEYSPFYEKEYSEFEYVDSIYNHYIHPQWDSIESETLFVKIIFADYEEGYAFIELIGEWNDAIHNDIEYLKGNLLEILVDSGINQIVLIGENVLNFHASDDCYYEELIDELDDGFIIGLNFSEHVINEFENNHIGQYISFGEMYDIENWRSYHPKELIKLILVKMNGLIS